MMKSFLYKATYFSIPFGLYLLLVLITDPYNYFSNNNFINNEIKTEISYKIHYPLWKLNKFKENPTDHVLLGDSRTDAISSNYINKITNKTYANLAYGGGSLQEIISTFWELTNYADLKNVYIGINFNLYNSYNRNNRVKEAIELNKNVFTYAFNRYTFKSTFYIIGAVLFNYSPSIGIPKVNKNEFWDYQLNSSAKKFYAKYNYPKNYYQELKKIALFCKQNNIHLVFFVPPTHIDLQKKVEEFFLIDEQKKFIADLNTIAITYNFDYPSVLTKNKKNFKDPFHLNNDLLNDVFGKILKQESPLQP